VSPADMVAAIAEAIELWSLQLRAPRAISRTALMRAIADVETRGGERWGATLHESAYCYGGKYYQMSAELRRLSHPWGCLAHSSFGPWQIMFITAHENGFSDDPVRLRDPMIGAEYLTKILNKRVFDKLPDATPEDAFDAWNSGRARDAMIPTDYIKKAKAAYLSHLGSA
jgi:hypothetical protein